MFKKLKYETPEIEITKFEISRKIMGNYGGGSGNDDGDEVTTEYPMSEVETTGYQWPEGVTW